METGRAGYQVWNACLKPSKRLIFLFPIGHMLQN